MGVPSGAEIAIYASKVKTAGRVRAAIRLDRPIADTDFTDEFAGASLDTTKWSYWQPPNTSITVSGGNLTLASTADTNGFPIVKSLDGAFPRDTSIAWTLEFTWGFPVITGFGSFFRVGDLTNSTAILAVKCNTADGLTLEMPDGTVKESLGADTASYDYQLIYTPGSPGQYELKRSGVSKGTLSAADKQAVQIAMGNGSVQTNLGAWTTCRAGRVDLNLTAYETQSYPSWANTFSQDGGVWAYLPNISDLSVSAHKRNDLDSVVLALPNSYWSQAQGYVTDLYAGFDWQDREIRIESQQSDGTNSTSWKEIFRGLCDEPAVNQTGGVATLSVTAREKVRRQLQQAHVVRGYSDNASAIDGLVMNANVTGIVQDICQVAGLAAADINVASVTLTPRSWQVLGESALEPVRELADQAVLAMWRNAGSANPGRLEIQEWAWGTDTPAKTFDVDTDIVGLDWARTDMGLVAQVVVTVQHSEFGEFSDVYPHAPFPAWGAIVRVNASIAQVAADINVTRILPFLLYRVLNRELSSVVVDLVGQDWFEHDIEFAVQDQGKLGIASDYWIVDGWEYKWNPTEGFRTSAHLVNQHHEKSIMRSSLNRTVAVNYA